MGHELVPEAAFSGSPACSLAVSARAASSTADVAGLDPVLGQAIQPRSSATGSAANAGLVAGGFPAPEDHAELRAPVAQVVVADDALPRASKIRARLSPMTVERMWPTCIGLATFGDE